MRNIQIFIVLVAAVLSVWLSTQLDHGLGLDWPHVAVRNWEQYGFFPLHGKIVINAGGFQADSQPEIYPGHRPASLYPVFLCHHFFTIIGLSSFGFIAYHAAIAAMVLLSIWWLLGRTEGAFWLAAITVVTPGFVRWQTSPDPNLTAVLFGFPFCAAVVILLQRPSMDWRQIAKLFALILAYSMLNWSTAFVHGMLFVTLLALSRVPWRNLIIYAGLTATMAGWVVVTSVASTMNRGGSSEGFSTMYQAYGWGGVGYGQELTTKTAIVRLLAANILGLLPVLIYLGAQAWRRRDHLRPVGLFYLLPPMAVAFEMVVMRNYFGHHPWMSVDFVLLAIILAVVVWKDRKGTLPAARSRGLPVPLVWLVSAIAYSFVVLFATAAHNRRQLAFETFVREQTARNATIFICHDTDPALAELAERLNRLVDRHLLVVDDVAQVMRAGIPAKDAIVLTTVQPTDGRILFRTTLEDRPPAGLGSLLQWYSKYIAHRRTGDQLKISGEMFFLYQPAN